MITVSKSRANRTSGISFLVLQYYNACGIQIITSYTVDLLERLSTTKITMPPITLILI
jgi:hypothetical protein